jgi:hypothetical protein
MVGYQPKNYELMQTVGMEKHYVRIDAFDPEEVSERIEALHESLPEVQARQFDGCKAVKVKLLGFRDRIHALAGLEPPPPRRRLELPALVSSVSSISSVAEGGGV